MRTLILALLFSAALLPAPPQLPKRFLKPLRQQLPMIRTGIANPIGRHGSPYSPDSINNPSGQYGSPYSPQGRNNPYGTGWASTAESGHWR
jgi:hypothetical protein